VRAGEPGRVGGRVGGRVAGREDGQCREGMTLYDLNLHALLQRGMDEQILQMDVEV
jgi:hypothetical protein